MLQLNEVRMLSVFGKNTTGENLLRFLSQCVPSNSTKLGLGIIDNHNYGEQLLKFG